MQCTMKLGKDLFLFQLPLDILPKIHLTVPKGLFTRNAF